MLSDEKFVCRSRLWFRLSFDWLREKLLTTWFEHFLQVLWISRRSPLWHDVLISKPQKEPEWVQSYRSIYIKLLTLFQVSFHQKFVLLLIPATNNQVIFWTYKPEELLKPVCLSRLLDSSCCLHLFESFLRFSFCRLQGLESRKIRFKRRNERDISLFSAVSFIK